MEKRYSISDAARQLNVESHVLRYWELELGLHIARNSQGHRFYQQDDIELLRAIKDLKEQGFQLKAIKLILPDIKNVRQMNPQKLYRLREELNQQVQIDEASSGSGSHYGQVMPLHPQNRNVTSRYPSDNYESSEDKLRHFEAMMRKMIRTTVEDMERESEERICERITTKLMKEMDYLTRQKEELQERQITLLQQILTEVQNGGIAEAAASTEQKGKLPAGTKNTRKAGEHHKKLFAKKK
ncbi:MAG: helix-turn-helix domain-containing protein [Clostridiaceae bacterium]|nr:helix-turn-helix domain-containing protein [Clostridiaceae bacterium]